MPKPINLERWEINLILHALAKLPYEEVHGVIHRIKEQVEPAVETIEVS